MITCPQCGSQNLPGMAYCENCGSPLPQQSAPVESASTPDQATAVATAEPTAPATTTTTTTTFTPVSAPAPAVSNTTGVAPAPTPVDPAAVMLPQPVMPADLPPTRTEISVPSPVQTASFGTGANAIAADEATMTPAQDTNQGTGAGATTTMTPGGTGTLNVVFPNGQSFVMEGDHAEVGRADVAQNWHPELDVIPFGGGAPDLGVSRHHARLERRDGGFAVIDVGSTNGTYINGRVAPYNQPVSIKDGDTLSFGALNTQLVVSH